MLKYLTVICRCRIQRAYARLCRGTVRRLCFGDGANFAVTIRSEWKLSSPGEQLRRSGDTGHRYSLLVQSLLTDRQSVSGE